MSKSIRISDELAASAEEAAAMSHRSPPQQIEHWAQIGRVLEPTLSYAAQVAVKQATRSDLDAILDRVETAEGIRQARAVILSTAGSVESAE